MLILFEFFGIQCPVLWLQLELIRTKKKISFWLSRGIKTYQNEVGSIIVIKSRQTTLVDSLFDFN